MMRALAEMEYEFEEPFVVVTTKYESVFGSRRTGLATAVAATVDWYRGPTSWSGDGHTSNNLQHSRTSNDWRSQ